MVFLLKWNEIEIDEMKFSWEKYNMLGVDEDGRMLFLHNEL